MAEKKWVVKPTIVENFVCSNDIREILDIVEPHDEVDEKTGEIRHRKAAFILAGPKGGRWTMSLPDYYWETAGDICQGDGFANGGWKAKRDDDGNIIFDEDGKPKMVFIRPTIYQAID